MYAQSEYILELPHTHTHTPVYVHAHICESISYVYCYTLADGLPVYMLDQLRLLSRELGEFAGSKNN